MANSNCDSCQTDYDFSRENSMVYIFLDYLRASFIEAACPNGHTERIFCTTTGLLAVAGHLPVILAAQPTPEVRQAADRAWKVHAETAPDPPPKPVPPKPERKAIMPTPKELPTYDITPTLSRMLARFEKTVEAMPDDLLYDELTMEHPSDLPTTWRGADTRPGDRDDKPKP